MVVIPENKNTAWLFPNAMEEKGAIFEYNKFELKYRTQSNKQIPVFIVLGSAKLKNQNNEWSEMQGEFIFSSWNVGNLEEVKKILGEDTDLWNKSQKFRITPKDDKLNLEPLPLEEVI